MRCGCLAQRTSLCAPQSQRLAQRARRSGLDLACAFPPPGRVAWVAIEAQLYEWLENRTECGFEVCSDQLATLGVDSEVTCMCVLLLSSCERGEERGLGLGSTLAGWNLASRSVPS